MFEKWADKTTKIFSKKAVENTKQAIVADVKENQTSYIMAGITGLVIATGVIFAIKGIVNGIATPPPTYSVTYNYYITLPPSGGA